MILLSDFKQHVYTALQICQRQKWDGMDILGCVLVQMKFKEHIILVDLSEFKYIKRKTFRPTPGN